MASRDYEDGWRAGFHDSQKWVLVLDRYQRDNLLSVLNLIGFPLVGVPPFTLLNSGDWLIEVVMQLAAPGTEAAFQMLAETTGEPILTRDEVLRRLVPWLNDYYQTVKAASE